MLHYHMYTGRGPKYGFEGGQTPLRMRVPKTGSIDKYAMHTVYSLFCIYCFLEQKIREKYRGGEKIGW